jgi:ABC-2 type transport system ATP-binding protein
MANGNPDISPPSDDIVIEAKDVRKYFPAGRKSTIALDKVCLRVKKGLVTGLIGPDGAGKTTLMRLASGLLRPDSGSVTVLGHDAAEQSLTVQSSIGYMPQRFGLYEDLTVSENLNLYSDLQGVPEDMRPERFEELMHMTGLGEFTERLAGRLSGGMKQKLGLACTLVRSPRLLLLDEPTVGVDPVSRRELWAIVYRLVREAGMSVLLSTAYLDEAEHCDEVVILDEGKVLGEGPPLKFSAPLRGRTYAVTVPGRKNRTLQETLFRAPGVIDAVVQGDSVRLVMEGGAQPSAGTLGVSAENLSLRPVEPRFEDGFMALLREQRPKSASHAGAETVSGRERHGAPDAPVIEVRDLERRFGGFYAVRGVTFSVMRGEVFGLIGANGAGKSTTFRMLCGLLPVSAGSLRVAGVDLRRAPAAARARIGYMSQKFSLYGNLTVRENLGFFSSAYNLTGTRRDSRIDWALKGFGLGDMADAVSITLPLGHKQRLAMACALMHEPDILFLDEPTSGVDPIARREFWHRINALAEEGVTVMVTTHFMEEAEYCDRLAVMSAGEILALGTPAYIRGKVRSSSMPEPTMEDAFISLIENDVSGKAVVR